MTLKVFGFTICPILLLSLLFSAPARGQDTSVSAPSKTEASPTPSPSPPPDEENKPLGTITKIRFEGEYSVAREVVADIATLKVGDVFTRKKLENSINDLRKWGIFSQVEVLVAYDGPKIELTYQLKQGYTIKEVTIKGNYPIMDSKVRQTLFLNPGLLYDSTKLPEQIDRLDHLYEINGYFGTTVLAVEDYDESNHQVSLYFRIKKGTTYRLRDYTIEGNTALNEKRIRTIIFTYSHYKPKSIKKDLQKIQDLYKKKGFVRARVRLEGETYDYDARKVDIDVLIRQGPQVKVAFEGNDHFFNRTLKKELTIYEGGDFDEFELDASKKKLIIFYQQRGFENVQVTWTEKKVYPGEEKEKRNRGKAKGKEEGQKPAESPPPSPGPESRSSPETKPKPQEEPYHLVTFHISEGPQRRVKAIDFSGNKNISGKRLRSLMATKENSIAEKGYYLQPLFEQDLVTLEDYYREQGFLEMEIKNWEKSYSPWGDKVTLSMEIREGPRAMVQELRVKGLPAQFQETIPSILSLQPGTFYSKIKLENDLQTILVSLANQGYPYATVTHEATEVSPQEYEVTFTVKSGKLVRIGRMLFVGDNLTDEGVLRQNMRIKEGDLFSTGKILQSQLNLRGLGVFDGVDIQTLGLTSLRDVVNLVVRLQEKKTKVIDAEVGYNTDYGVSGRLVFSKLNLLGHAKTFNVKAQAGQQLNRLELNYIDPRIYGKSLQLTLGVYGGLENRPFFNDTSVGGYASIFKLFTRYLNAYGRIDLSYSNNNTTNTVFNQINPTPSLNQTTRFIPTFGTTFDTRDNFGDPRSGAYLNGSLSLTKQFIQANGNYLTMGANLGYWYSPLRRITIAQALRIADILTFPADTIVPASDRLYAGGDNTVRGFKQDSLLPSGGTFSIIYNLELQMRLFKNFQLVGFLDNGAVTNSVTDVNLTTLRHSAGPGIRYVTPVGPIRLDWGFVLDPQPGDATTNRIHIAFGYFF